MNCGLGALMASYSYAIHGRDHSLASSQSSLAGLMLRVLHLQICCRCSVIKNHAIDTTAWLLKPPQSM